MNWRKLRHVSAAFGTGIPVGTLTGLTLDIAFPTWVAVTLGLMAGWGATEAMLKEDK